MKTTDRRLSASKRATVTCAMTLLLLLVPSAWKCWAPTRTADRPASETRMQANVMCELQRMEKERGDAMEYLFAIAMRESGIMATRTPPNHRIYNRFGYRGMFQFGHLALKETGYEHVTFVKFRANPGIWTMGEQYDAMVKLLEVNRRYLGDYIEAYDGDTVAGIVITKAGMLAGAHLLGARRVKRFLDRDGRYNPRDGFKTSLAEYLTLFSAYDYPDTVPEGLGIDYMIEKHEMLCDKVRAGRWDYLKNN